MARIAVRPRRNEEERCVYCHGEDDARGTDAEIVSCVGCGALMHVECRIETPRCPTFGCRFRTTPGNISSEHYSALERLNERARRAQPVAARPKRRACSWPAVVGIMGAFVIAVSVINGFVAYRFGVSPLLLGCAAGPIGGLLAVWLRRGVEDNGTA